MLSPLYIAVDLGAGSGRVFLGGVGPGELMLEEVHRFKYPPTEKDGHLRWPFETILSEILFGLGRASARGREFHRPIASLGVDSWGVDYGLLDHDGKLIAEPVCYRDDLTVDAMAKAFQKIPRPVIFEKTGIQFLNFNTIFQLISESTDLERVDRLLLLPDLINFFLTGIAVSEYTNSTTTQMVDAATGDWDFDLLSRMGIPSRILSPIVPAGTVLGPLRPAIAAELGLEGVQVTAPGTHDTASAIAGAPLNESWAYISSGTWSLIGIERTATLINAEVERFNFTNEGGVYGTTRFLKNVMGLWIFERCRREWEQMGMETDYASLLHDVAEIEAIDSFIFPDDQRFLNPPSMLDAINGQLAETGQRGIDEPAAVSKLIFDSLAFRYASVLTIIRSLTGANLSGVQILGGGGRNRYLNQLTADASGLTARAGLVEATVVGNILVQAVASGRFASLSEARRHVTDNFEFEEFKPRDSPRVAAAAERYAEIEAQFLAA